MWTSCYMHVLLFLSFSLSVGLYRFLKNKPAFLCFVLFFFFFYFLKSWQFRDTGLFLVRGFCIDALTQSFSARGKKCCFSCQPGSIHFYQRVGRTYKGETQTDMLARNHFYCLLDFRCTIQLSPVSGWGEDGFSESLHTTLGGLGRGGAWVDRAEVLQSYFGSRKTCTLLQTSLRESLSGIVQVLHWISPPVLSPLLLYLECLFWALLKRCCGFVRVQSP